MLERDAAHGGHRIDHPFGSSPDTAGAAGLARRAGPA
jgi:hypothetical protein